MRVKLLIANTSGSGADRFKSYYDEDGGDLNRIFVEDHSPWEEIEDGTLVDLEIFVEDFNRTEKNKFAFLIIEREQISAQSAIQSIIDKKRKQQEKRAQDRLALELKFKQEQEKRAAAKKEKEIEKARKLLEGLNK